MTWRRSRKRKLASFTAEEQEWLRRFLELTGRASERMRRLRFSSPFDEYFYEEWRAALLEAGATIEEMDRIAAGVVLRVAQVAQADPDVRDEQIELIAHHLACTDMHIGFRKGRAVWVDFPNRPKVQ